MHSFRITIIKTLDFKQTQNNLHRKSESILSPKPTEPTPPIYYGNQTGLTMQASNRPSHTQLVLQCRGKIVTCTSSDFRDQIKGKL